MEVALSVVWGGTAALFTLSAVAHVMYMFRREYDFLAKWATRVAWLVQTVGLVLLLVQTGWKPFESLFGFTYVFSWIMVTPYVVIEVLRNNRAPGSFLLPVIAVLQVIGVALPKPFGEHIYADQFAASLVGWHIGVTMMGYGFFIASFVAGALYILQERNLRNKSWGPLYYRLPSLETLDIWGGRFIYLGFPLLTLGTGVGLVFAHVKWTFWESDPKILFTVFVWLVYAGYLFVRNVWGWGGRKTAWWSVVGVAGLMVNFFVMNWLSRLHRFD